MFSLNKSLTQPPLILTNQKQPPEVFYEKKLTLETDINRFFETNIQAAAINAPDTAVLWYDRPYIQQEQVRLDENFRQYFEGITMSNKTLRAGMQKTPYQKNYEINSGA